jgi:hypothetical protein
MDFLDFAADCERCGEYGKRALAELLILITNKIGDESYDEYSANAGLEAALMDMSLDELLQSEIADYTRN